MVFNDDCGCITPLTQQKSKSDITYQHMTLILGQFYDRPKFLTAVCISNTINVLTMMTVMTKCIKTVVYLVITNQKLQQSQKR